MSATPIKIVCQSQLLDLQEDFALAGGTTLPAGTRVLLLPETTAQCVLVESENRDLNVVLVGQNANLAGFSTQLVQYANRLNTLELWAVSQGYTLPSTNDAP